LFSKKELFMPGPFRLRQSVPFKAAVAAPNNQFDEYLGRVIRLIPSDIVALYLVGSGLLAEDDLWPSAVWSGFCLAALIVIRVYGTRDDSTPPKPDLQAVFWSAAAFVVWVYTLGGPFRAFDLANPGWHIHEPKYGSLLVLACSFLVPYFYKGS
jgi:hypothetical protein